MFLDGKTILKWLNLPKLIYEFNAFFNAVRTPVALEWGGFNKIILKFI